VEDAQAEQIKPGVPKQLPFDEFHQVIHRHPATVGGVEGRLCEPGVDGS